MTRGRTALASLLAFGMGILTACSSAAPLAAPSPSAAVEAVVAEPTAAEPQDRVAPRGSVRVAYADVPASWSGVDPDDTAAIDLAALWSLPLYRYDPDGQLVPALAVGASFPEVADGWAVELTLAQGRWSDGGPVTAADAVATVEALRDARPDEWSALTAVEAIDERRLQLRFEHPVGRWAHLLTGPPGVLPADLVVDGGLDAFAEELPVVGGWFELTSYEPGHSATFTAHPDGPLGAPSLEQVEVLFVPSYETALGLLAQGEADLVLGHLALNPVERALRLDEVRAEAPLGGTFVSLEWLPAGNLGDDPATRRASFAALELGELVGGLLGETGGPATSPIPGMTGPLDAAVSDRQDPVERDVIVLVPRWHEALGFTARTIQRDLTSAGAIARLVTAASPGLLDPVDPHDGALRVRRSTPRPPLSPEGDRIPPGPDNLVAEELAPAFDDIADAAWELPLYRIGVAHAWRQGLAGPEPSAWPGLALWNVGEWQVTSP